VESWLMEMRCNYRVGSISVRLCKHFFSNEYKIKWIC
jgi:hypothetical protein